jgi:TolA-binding protein
MTPEGVKLKDPKAGISTRMILAAAAAVILSAAAVISPGCGGEEKSPTYKAERELFNARKYAGELTFPTLNAEFLNRTLAAYRGIIDRYGVQAGSDADLEIIVVTARMELAELEFRASMFDDSRRDFLRAYEIAENVPAARTNALWSAAFISREGGDDAEALRLFTKFHEEYLTDEKILETAGLNRRYLLTPIRIAELCRKTADYVCAEKWLEEAKRLYGHIIRSDVPGDLRKEARYNLVSSYLLSEEWTEARKTIREMRKEYGNEADVPSLLYLEARIELDGFGDRGKALAVLDRIVSGHPGSQEAPAALLIKGGILFEDGRYDEAAAAYRLVIDEYEESGPEMVEALWQLAILEEERGDWIEASLHYKSIYTNFPSTIQGMEAPLRVAAHYRETGESEALEAAYERAAAHYERLSSLQYSETFRIVAEEYYVRTLIEQKRWEDAASRLLSLPDRYPQYHRFKGNCLMAASIYENELGDIERAAEILRGCAAKYPGTQFAAEARKQLERIGDPR